MIKKKFKIVKVVKSKISYMKMTDKINNNLNIFKIHKRIFLMINNKANYHLIVIV